MTENTTAWTILIKQTMGNVITINAFGDNLIYLYQYAETKAFAVDPGDAEVVLRVIKEHNLKLTEVLATHYHWDHIGGIAQLKHATDCRVISGIRNSISIVDDVVTDGDVIIIDGINIRTIATPGHTRTPVCYYLEKSGSEKNGIIWTGDTLFVGGCGRLFECDARTMWHSLQKLTTLPDDTLVYPGHDYAIENYEFALMIEPDNFANTRRLAELRDMQQQTGQAVPSTIGQEKLTNIFLRADSAQVRAALKMPDTETIEVFAQLRRQKDHF